MLATEPYTPNPGVRQQSPCALQPDGRLAISILSDPCIEDLDAICRIYTDSIPRCEQDPLADLRDWVWRTDQRLIVARCAGEIVGFSSLYLAAEFCFLEYMAVDRHYRGQGIGGDLFRATVRVATAVRPGAALLLEVEADSPGEPDARERRERHEFYYRLGCRPIPGLSYRLPPRLSELQPGMDLLVYVGVPTPSIPRPLMGRWLSEIYGQVYGCSPADPRIAEMLGALPDPVPLR